MFTAGAGHATRGEPFVTAAVNRQQATVGEPLIVDYAIFTPVFSHGINQLDLAEPPFHDVWFQEITDRRSPSLTGRLGRYQIGGQNWEASLVKSFVVVPLRAGELELPSVAFDVALMGTGGNPQRRLESPPLKLQVSAPPAATQPVGFVPANVGEVKFSVVADRTTGRVGDSVNLTLSVTGAGMIASFVLPSLPAIPGVRVLEPDTDYEMQTDERGWLGGAARSRVSLVLEAEGEIVLPPLEFIAFNPWRLTYDRLTSEPIQLRVQGVNPNAIANSTVEDEQERAAWLAQLPPLRTMQAASGPPLQPHRSPLFPLAICAGPLAWVGVELTAGLRRRRAATAGTRVRKNAVANAQARLKVAREAADAGAVAELLRTCVAELTGEATNGLTHSRLRERLEARWSAELSGRVVDAVRASEQARFGGATASATLFDDAARILSELEAR